MKRLAHRVLRSLGFHLERHRDPYNDIVRLIDPRSVTCCIDGGVFRGDTTLQFLRDFPNAKIISIEANPDLAENLKQTITDSRVEILNKALTDKPGELTFHIPEAAFTGSLLTPGAEFGASRKVTVQGVTLNSLGCKPEVLKLDLQGAELMAMRGGTAILPTVQVFLCEVNFVPRYEGCALFDQVSSLAAEFGLRLFRLYEVHAANDGQWQFADALFVRRDK